MSIFSYGFYFHDCFFPVDFFFFSESRLIAYTGALELLVNNAYYILNVFILHVFYLFVPLCMAQPLKLRPTGNKFHAIKIFQFPYFLHAMQQSNDALRLWNSTMQVDLGVSRFDAYQRWTGFKKGTQKTL